MLRKGKIPRTNDSHKRCFLLRIVQKPVFFCTNSILFPAPSDFVCKVKSLSFLFITLQPNQTRVSVASLMKFTLVFTKNLFSVTSGGDHFFSHEFVVRFDKAGVQQFTLYGIPCFAVMDRI